jgi:hypothetical protein
MGFVLLPGLMSTGTVIFRMRAVSIPDMTRPRLTRTRVVRHGVEKLS